MRPMVSGPGTRQAREKLFQFGEMQSLCNDVHKSVHWYAFRFCTAVTKPAGHRKPERPSRYGTLTAVAAVRNLRSPNRCLTLRLRWRADKMRLMAFACWERVWNVTQASIEESSLSVLRLPFWRLGPSSCLEPTRPLPHS